MDNLDMDPSKNSLALSHESASVVAKRGAATRKDGTTTTAREEKRRKWQAKQDNRKLLNDQQEERKRWILNNSHFASIASKEDANQIAEKRNTNTALADALQPYFNLQDSRSDETMSKSSERLFIAEGTETIRILIQQSLRQSNPSMNPIRVKSIFVKPSVFFDSPVHLLQDIQKIYNTSKYAEEAVKIYPPFQVIIGTEDVLSNVAGFHIARGALACGVVPLDRDELWLDQLLRRRYHEKNGRIRVLALDGICDTANLGSMIRSASAFGMDAVVLSDDCCDAWYRRSVRVSMGHVFLVPIVRVRKLADFIHQWSSEPFRLLSYAAVVDPEADIILEDLERGMVPSGWMCVIGNEGNGISSAVRRACEKSIRINMAMGVDSLSVPIAAGILLHGLQAREAKSN